MPKRFSDKIKDPEKREEIFGKQVEFAASALSRNPSFSLIKFGAKEAGKQVGKTKVGGTLLDKASSYVKSKMPSAAAAAKKPPNVVNNVVKDTGSTIGVAEARRAARAKFDPEMMNFKDFSKPADLMKSVDDDLADAIHMIDYFKKQNDPLAMEMYLPSLHSKVKALEKTKAHLNDAYKRAENMGLADPASVMKYMEDIYTHSRKVEAEFKHSMLAGTQYGLGVNPARPVTTMIAAEDSSRAKSNDKTP